MIEHFLTVGTQVLVLFILIGVGVICTKAKLLRDTAVHCMADVVLWWICAARWCCPIVSAMI